MRILIVDDHPLFRIALRHILNAEFRDAEFGEASTAEEALEQVWRLDWAVLVLDISLPGRSGLDILKEIKQARPQLPVLIVSAHAEDQFAVRCLKAGAAGYLTKESAPAELVGAVHRLLAGRRFLTASLAEKLAELCEVDSDRAAHEQLSTREFEILRLISTGLALKEIAARLTLSIKTVSTYRARTLEKMHLKTNADLIRYCIDHKLTD